MQSSSRVTTPTHRAALSPLPQPLKPNTISDCETTDTGLVHHVVWQFMPRLSLSLHLPMEGWPGWVDLAGGIHTEMVHLPADSHPSKY